MNIPLGWILLVAAVAVGIWGTSRWLSEKEKEASQAASRAVTTPIDSASQVGAESNVRRGMAAAQAYLAENGSYAGISLLRLQRIDSSLAGFVQLVQVGDEFCLMSTVGRVSVHALQGATDTEAGPCPA